MHKKPIDKVNFLWYNPSEKRRTPKASANVRQLYIDLEFRGKRGNSPMNDNKNMEPQNAEESNIITLTDEDGKEIDFEVIGDAEIEGVVYYAMTPAGAQENNEGIIEYVLLKLVEDEEGEEVFVTVDDEDEFDKVADFFDDLFDSEEDYDA